MDNSQAHNKSIALSAALNIVRRACMIAFPLITYAYATRILGKSGIGIYEFAQSIVSYFSLIAALGITQYAVRDGARFLGRGRQMDDFASEIFSINLIMTIISYSILFLLIKFVPILNSYGLAIFIYSISILFTTLGVDWVNSLFEDYLYLTVRYIIISVISLLLLFVFVRGEEDLYWYIAVSIFALVANGIMNFFYVRRYVKIRFTFNLNLACHALPIFILFCNNIASVVYLNSDITILRLLSDDATVGLYGVASKIYSMIKELMNAAIFVTIPRFSAYVEKSLASAGAESKVVSGTGHLDLVANEMKDVSGDEQVSAVDETKNILGAERVVATEEAGKADALGSLCDIDTSNDYGNLYIEGLRNLLTPLLTVLIPACVGLYFMSASVINLVAGSDFVEGYPALRILSVSMFFAVMACFLAFAIIMPYKLERFFLGATIVAALLNIVLNLIMIPKIGMPAAALTTLLAEIVVFAILLKVAVSKVDFRRICDRKDIISIIAGSALVAIACLICQRVFGAENVSILSTSVTVILAVIAYAVLISFMGNSFVVTIKDKIHGVRHRKRA